MATKRNIARSGAMVKSFSSPQRASRRASMRATVGIGIGIGIEDKTTDPQKPHEVDRTRRPEPKTTRDQKPQNDPHKNHTRSTNGGNAQNGL